MSATHAHKDQQQQLPINMTPVGWKPPTTWDHDAHLALLQAIVDKAPPTQVEWENILEQVRKKGYTYSASAAMYVLLLLFFYFSRAFRLATATSRLMFLFFSQLADQKSPQWGNFVYFQRPGRLILFSHLPLLPPQSSRLSLPTLSSSNNLPTSFSSSSASLQLLASLSLFLSRVSQVSLFFFFSSLSIT